MDMDALEQWKTFIEQWNLQLMLRHAKQQFIPTLPPLQLYAPAIALVLLTTFLLLLARFFNRTKSNTILLSGLSGSGKTLLFYQKGKVKPVHVVDVPGHPRLRTKLDGFLARAACTVFVVDAVDFLPNLRATSEYLYDILTMASVVKKKVPLLILCNKVDKVTAHTKEFIRKQLEKEIDKLRASRTALSSADITNEYVLGVDGESFAFSQCLNRVSVAEASGLTGEISQLEQFIREHVNA